MRRTVFGRALPLLAIALGFLLPATVRGEDGDSSPLGDSVQRELLRLREQVEAQNEKIARLEARENRNLHLEIESYLESQRGLSKRQEKATAGYDNGFFIQDPEGVYRIEISGYAQARFDWNHRDGVPTGDDENTTGFSLRRVRLFLRGHVTEKFDYHLRLNVGSDGEVTLINAWGQFNFDSGWHLRAGLIFLAVSREDWQFPSDLLTTENSANDDVFANNTSLGLQVNRQTEKQRFWIAFSNGRNGGNTTFSDPTDADWAFSGRYELQLTGTNWSVWDDLIGRRGRAQGILVGIGALYQGQGAPFSVDSPKRLGEISLDLSFNGDGYQILFALNWQHLEIGDGTPSFYNGGALLQGGYFFTEKWQAYGRYEIVSPGDQPGDLDDYNAIALGVSWLPFPNSNHNKLSFEFGYLFSVISSTIVPPSASLGFLSSDSADQFYLRVQLQFGF